MKEASQLRDALLALTKDVAEYALYLRELGVEGLESSQTAAAPLIERASAPALKTSESAPKLSDALRRNAQAEAVKAQEMIKTLPPPIPGGALRSGGLSPASPDQTEMAKKPVRRPAAEPPAPRETLFGEITPQDELSLPRPGETIEDIRADIGECMRCPLCQSRTTVVNSDGNSKARLMFVGEAPGADEDAQGKPFVGRAGQLLNKIIEAIGMKREDVFIGNVNRCRPPQNRTPTAAEAATCKPFLLREIAVVKPEIIVVLGNTAMKNLLDTKEGITKLRGHFQDYRGIKVMPTFHPAYLLRDPSKKREAWDDMKKVRDYLNRNQPGK